MNEKIPLYSISSLIQSYDYKLHEKAGVTTTANGLGMITIILIMQYTSILSHIVSLSAAKRYQK
jgi:hypothetical protein